MRYSNQRAREPNSQTDGKFSSTKTTKSIPSGSYSLAIFNGSDVARSWFAGVTAKIMDDGFEMNVSIISRICLWKCQNNTLVGLGTIEITRNTSSHSWNWISATFFLYSLTTTTFSQGVKLESNQQEFLSFKQKVTIKRTSISFGWSPTGTFVIPGKSMRVRLTTLWEKIFSEIGRGEIP